MCFLIIIKCWQSAVLTLPDFLRDWDLKKNQPLTKPQYYNIFNTSSTNQSYVHVSWRYQGMIHLNKWQGNLLMACLKKGKMIQKLKFTCFKGILKIHLFFSLFIAEIKATKRRCNPCTLSLKKTNKQYLGH